jgi:hypothetical protein
MLPTPIAASGRQRGGRTNSRGGRTLTEVAMLPTPRASDATKGPRSSPVREGNEGPTLVEALNMGLIPTPVARDHKGRGRAGQLPTLMLPTPTSTEFKRANEDAKRQGTRGGRRLMLPTPTAADGHRASNQYARGNPTLNGAVKLLPTPTAQDARASGTAANRTPDSERHSGATLTDVIVREIDIGSSSPALPTGTGAARLNPAFVTWMMGLPDGWAVIPLTPRHSTSWATVSSPRRRPTPSSSSGSDMEQLSLLGDGGLATGKTL